jgi:CHAD domain-containing protein
LAAQKASQDIEHVHQLRVSVRRAKAAMELYGDLLPSKKAKSLNQMLRRLRKAAGEARDLDVLIERLSAHASEESSLRPLLKEMKAYRKAAQKPLKRSYKRAKQEGFRKQSRKLLKSIRYAGIEPVFVDFARMAFQPMVDDFFQAGAADLTSVNALHQMRISGKQMRYAIELLAGAFGRAFRDDLYPVFGEIQEQLGAINDHATAITLFNSWSERSDQDRRRIALGELVLHERLQLQECRAKFLDWWTDDRAAELAAKVNAALGSDRKSKRIAGATSDQLGSTRSISSAG